MKMLFILSFLTNSFLFISSHPIITMISILSQTTLTCVIIWMMMKMSWFSFILFLIFLGGLMVLFIYITSLASNEMFSMNLIKSLLIFSASIMMITMMTNKTGYYDNIQYFSKNLISIIKMIFSKSYFIPSIIIMTYLLYTLIVAVKIATKMEGPIRNIIK